MEILKCPEVLICLNPELPPGQTTAPLTKSKSYSTNTVTMEHQWHLLFPWFVKCHLGTGNRVYIQKKSEKPLSTFYAGRNIYFLPRRGDPSER